MKKICDRCGAELKGSNIPPKNYNQTICSNCHLTIKSMFENVANELDKIGETLLRQGKITKEEFDRIQKKRKRNKKEV